jgi:hypothetical protein
VNTLTTASTALVMDVGANLRFAPARWFARDGMQVYVARRNAELPVPPPG